MLLNKLSEILLYWNIVNVANNKLSGGPAPGPSSKYFQVSASSDFQFKFSNNAIVIHCRSVKLKFSIFKFALIKFIVPTWFADFVASVLSDNLSEELVFALLEDKYPRWLQSRVLEQQLESAAAQILNFSPKTRRRCGRAVSTDRWNRYSIRSHTVMG